MFCSLDEQIRRADQATTTCESVGLRLAAERVDDNKISAVHALF